MTNDDGLPAEVPFELPKDLLNALSPPRDSIMMTGAFGSLYNFLNFVVFCNCQDYFDLLKDADKQDLTRKKQSQALFNAVVALDSAADYLYFAEPRQEKTTLEFLKTLNVPALLQIREIANAVKHCILRNPDKVQAATVAKPTCNVHADTSNPEAVRLKLQISVSFFEEANPNIKAAMRFWFEQLRLIEDSRPRITE